MLYAVMLITWLVLSDISIGIHAQTSGFKGSGPRGENNGKSIIVSYMKNRMTEEEILKSKKKFENECGCDVRHLSHVGAFILTYRRGITVAATQIQLNSAFMQACDDGVIRIDPPKKIKKYNGKDYERSFLKSSSTSYSRNNEIFGTKADEQAILEEARNISIRQTPSDPNFNLQWPLANLNNNADINAQSGWDEYLLDPVGALSTCPAVTIAVIDTGIDYNHPDLANVMWVNQDEISGDGIDNDGNGIVDDIHGADFSSLPSINGDPMDGNGHGTHCAGIIAAEENNGIGIAGVASYTQGKIRIMAIKGLSDTGTGSINGLLTGLDYALEKGAKISSNSWGSFVWNPAWDPVWSTVLQNNPQHIMVAASGNQGLTLSQSTKRLLCSLDEPNLLCIASSKNNDQASSFSNIGKEIVHVFAPGQSIYSTDIANSYSYKTGTSMACPHASGLAGLILSMRDKLIGQDVRQLIECGVSKRQHYKNLVSSGGLIDVFNTIKLLKKYWRPCSDVQGDGSGVHTYPAHVGDVDGDGMSDVIFIGQNWNGAGLNIRTKFSKGGGTWTHKYQGQGDGSGVHSHPAHVGDVNGDGKADLVFIGQNWNGAGLNIRTKLSNGDGTWVHKYQVQGDGSGVHVYPSHMGDVNGDGKADLIFVGQNWNGAGLNIRTKLSNGDGTWVHKYQVQGDGSGVHVYPSHIGDVNGDGKTDLIFIGQNWNGAGLNIRTKLSNGDGTWTHKYQVQGDGSGVHSYPSHVGDVNGDGKDDLVFVGQNWNGAGLNIRTKFSNGDGTWTHKHHVLGDGSGVHTYPSHIGDVNGDGKADLVFVGQNWSGTGLNIRTKLSNGDGTWTAIQEVLGDGSGVHTHPALIGDFNNDDKTDILFVGQNWSGGGLNMRTKFAQFF